MCGPTVCLTVLTLVGSWLRSVHQFITEWHRRGALVNTALVYWTFRGEHKLPQMITERASPLPPLLQHLSAFSRAISICTLYSNIKFHSLHHNHKHTLAQILLLFTSLCYSSSYIPVVAYESKVPHIYSKQLSSVFIWIWVIVFTKVTSHVNLKKTGTLYMRSSIIVTVTSSLIFGKRLFSNARTI